MVSKWRIYLDLIPGLVYNEDKDIGGGDGGFKKIKQITGRT